MAPFDEAEFAERHRRVRARMEAEGLDALIAYSTVKARGAVQYLANYSVRHTGAQSRPNGDYSHFGSCALLFPLEGDPVLLMDQDWDLDRALEVSFSEDTRHADDVGADLGRLVAGAGHRRVGIDNWFLFPAAQYLPLRELVPEVELVPTRLVEEVYRVKSPREIEVMRRAEDAAVLAVEEAMAAVAVGVPEFDFALAAEIALRRHGDIDTAGPAIVRGGPNTSTAMGFPSRDDSHVMRPGDWALFDITPAYQGYAGDISRMIVAGSLDDLDPDLKRLYDVTLRINEEVIARIRPGVAPVELTRLADAIAEEAGFGDNRIGLLGHGLGIDMHDPPDYYFDATPLEANTIFTVEPCLTVAGVAGTRIEDVVLVTHDGCEVLSAGSPKDLRGTDD